MQDEFRGPSKTACPHCGHVYHLPIKDIERQVCHAVGDIARHSGKASTQAVALAVSLSASQTGRYLKRLEETGRVQRIGTKKGWRLAA
jgi:hypothetical protein